MTTQSDARNQFRGAFVLLLVLSISIVFVATVKGFLAAMFMAAVLAGLVYPVYRWILVRFHGRETLASMTTLLIVIVVGVFPLIAFLGVVVGQAADITKTVAPWVEKQLQAPAVKDHSLPDWFPFAKELEPYNSEITEKVAILASKAGGFIVGSLSKATQVTAMFLLNLFVMLYAMFFFFIRGPDIVKTITGYLPLSRADKENLLEVGLSVSKATIKGTLVIGIVQGTLGGLGLAVAGIPGFAFWGTIMIVLSIIPGIGTALVWIPAVIYLAINGDTGAAIGLTVWSAAIVGTVDNVMRPRLVGKDTKMPDLLILISTLGGLGLFGALGLVVGPVIAALFLTVWTIYGQVFKDVLSEPESESEQESSESSTGEQTL
jgi:predicted PurR-regulated permease PerM